MRSWTLLLLLPALLIQGGPTHAGRAEREPAKAAAPEIAGEWTGTWGIYAPQADAPAGEAPRTRPAPRYPRLPLECTVEKTGRDRWRATFRGEAGGPYKYTIQMQGRRSGEVVLFKGTVDLGEKDGGIYDWIGRATDKEFVGFYTSRQYTGTFHLARPQAKAAAPRS